MGVKMNKGWKKQIIIHFKCEICGNEVDERDVIKLKAKNFMGLENDKTYYICKNCVIEKVLKPRGFKNFEDYLSRYWGIKDGKVE
jgi:hypothetical protein